MRAKDQACRIILAAVGPVVQECTSSRFSEGGADDETYWLKPELPREQLHPLSLIFWPAPANLPTLHPALRYESFEAQVTAIKQTDTLYPEEYPGGEYGDSRHQTHTWLQPTDPSPCLHMTPRLLIVSLVIFIASRIVACIAASKPSMRPPFLCYSSLTTTFHAFPPAASGSSAVGSVGVGSAP